MATKGHLLYYPEGKHDILLGKELNDVLKSKVNSVTKITYQDLKKLRDNSKLTPGALYRITDYQCTTTQENTKSAGHQFDIVLLALSEDKLAEEGWAMMHDNIYDVTFADGVTKKCYLFAYVNGSFIAYNIVDVETKLGVGSVSELELQVNEETKTITTEDWDSTELIDENLTYNYFQNSNLSAWKVWYCLDNDTDRFAWADKGMIDINNYLYDRYSQSDSDGFYAWYNEEDGVVYTRSNHPKQGDAVYNGDKELTPIVISSFVSNGRGVIYRLIDEFNNDIKYDFKNIQFKRKLTDGQYDANGTETWCYTLNLWYEDMCQDASIIGNTLPNDEGYINGVYDNVFGYATAFNFYIEGVDTFTFALGNNVVLSFDNGGYFGIYSNTIGNSFFNNTIGESFYFNTIENSFCNNTVGNSFFNNTIGNYFNKNTVGNEFGSNTVGNNFYHNKIGNEFYANIIGNNFYDKTISDNTGDKNYGNNGVELATKNDLN